MEKDKYLSLRESIYKSSHFNEQPNFAFLGVIIFMILSPLTEIFFPNYSDVIGVVSFALSITGVIYLVLWFSLYEKYVMVSKLKKGLVEYLNSSWEDISEEQFKIEFQNIRNTINDFDIKNLST